MTEEQTALLKRLEMPVVTIGSRFDCFDYVDTDPEEGMYQMTKHVLSCGHRRIAVINGPAASQTSARKRAGIERAMAEAQCALREDWVEAASFSGLGGYNAMKRLWEGGARPTAVLTALDVLAAGAIRFLQENGLQVPCDISVTGYEDGLLAEYMSPALTTVCSHKEKLGRNASRILAHRVEHPSAQQVRLIIPPELIIRHSVQSFL